MYSSSNERDRNSLTPTLNINADLLCMKGPGIETTKMPTANEGNLA